MRRGAFLPVEILKSIRLAPTNTVPVRTSHLGPCLSKMGPMNRPPKNTTKVYIENIQPTVPSSYSLSWFVIT